jgi:IstB-like ATP binding protein
VRGGFQFAFPDAVGSAFDQGDVGVMSQAIQQSGDAGGVGENGIPVFEGLVGGQQNRIAFVTMVNHFEEQVGGMGVVSQISTFVEQMCRDTFLDEVGYLNLRPEQTNLFFKLMEERYRRRATLITTNLEYDQWARLLGNKDLTEALLSRLRHQCQTIYINGPSLREPQG